MLTDILSAFRPTACRNAARATLLLATALAAVQPAGASTMTGQVTFDWTTFTVTPIDIGLGLPQLTWTNQSDDTGASYYGYYWNPGITDHASDWTTGASATQTQNSSKFSLSTSGSTTATELLASSSLTLPGSDYAYWNFSSYSQRSGQFTIDGTGILLFQVEYTASAQSDSTRYGWLTPNAQLTVYSDGNDGSGSSNSRFSQGLYNNASDPVSLNDSGILQVAMLFRDGWTGSLQAESSLSGYVSGSEGGGGNPVPIPPAVWLFGSALGILLQRRQHSRNPARSMLS